MRKYIWTILLCITALGCNSCDPDRKTSSAPDPDMAATSAIKFVKESFIDLNQPGAYSLLSAGMQRKLTEDQFIDLVARMHPKAFPRVLTATEYETLPRQDMANIFLYGENGDKKFYYRLTMVDASYGNYKVAALFRIAEQPASPSRKPLPIKRSTADLR
ncbi:MAG TPA: hypothetical protein VF553_10260 [Pyrinomonadaceae bacterium]|jgi:hypothetical protein